MPLLDLLLSLTVCAVAGRVVLSWLPPGDPGAQSPGPLPVTWAAALVLGVLIQTTALEVLRAWLDGEMASLGLPVPWFPYASALVWGGLAVVRWRTLPGAMVPRHPLPESPATPALRGVHVVVWGLILTAGLRWLQADEGQLVIVAAAWLGIGLHGLRLLRLHPLARAVTAAALLSALLLDPRPSTTHWLSTFPVVTLVAVGGLGWTLRADRRGRAVAAVALAAWVGEGSIAVTTAAGIALALVAATHRNARRQTAEVLGIALLLGCVPRLLVVAFGAAPDLAAALTPSRPPYLFDRDASWTLLGLWAVACPVAWWRHVEARRGVLWLATAPLFLALLLVLTEAGLPLPDRVADGLPLLHWSGLIAPFAALAALAAVLPVDPAGETA